LIEEDEKEILKIFNDKKDETRKASKIQNRQDLENYLYYIIDPFQSIENIIIKLSLTIEGDYNKNKSKTKTPDMPDKINKELNKYHIFKYNINPPTDHTSYEISFYDKNTNKFKQNIPFDSLSSGEKMIFELICYYFVCSEDKDHKIDLILLDEFDANLNPSLAELYLEVVNKEFIEKGIRVILTTHSPSTVACVKSENLYEMKNENNKCEIIYAKNDAGKKDIVEKLAPKFIFHEEIGLFGTMFNTKKDIIVFVEGKTDKAHFDVAREKLNRKDNYEFIDCDGADNILHIMRSITGIKELKDNLQNKKIVALWDFDGKGKSVISQTIDNKYLGETNDETKDYFIL
jgi:5S rRNA maturation endonuclease (ribonuclease M5)